MTAPNRNTAVVTTERAAIAYPLRSPVADILTKEAARAEIERMLRPGDSFDRIVVEVYHAASNNPDILKCTPQSIVSAVARAVSTGLIIGEGVHLVPFGQKLQSIIDYKGKTELIVRAGAARHIDAHCVYAKEPFVYTQGTNPTIDHRPILSAKSRGEMVGAYAVAFLGVGRFMSVVLSTDEIEAVRQKYSKQHKGGELPYWYAEKTCVHRLAKLLPKNPELAKVIAMFDREEEELDEALAAEGEELDPAGQIAGPSLQLQKEEPAAATEFEAAPVTLAGPSKAALFPLPFGRESKGRAIGELDPKRLLDAYNWAKEQTDPAKLYPEFISAAEELFEQRRAAEEPF